MEVDFENNIPHNPLPNSQPQASSQTQNPLHKSESKFWTHFSIYQIFYPFFLRETCCHFQGKGKHWNIYRMIMYGLSFYINPLGIITPL